ncbi:MAG: hypothetical protein ONB13_05440, partial [candidate division KSB1 bacterium]|nr:hypothetical protein [candidate division KSB1 bacterium]
EGSRNNKAGWVRFPQSGPIPSAIPRCRGMRGKKPRRSNMEMEHFYNVKFSLLERAENRAKLYSALKHNSLLPSGSYDQQLLNKAVADYLEKLATEKIETINDAILAFVYAKVAVEHINVQKTKYLPEEVIKAKKYFRDVIFNVSRYDKFFPLSSRKLIWAELFKGNVYQIYEQINTPFGPTKVGLVKPTDSKVWFPFISRKFLYYQGYYIYPHSIKKNTRLKVQPIYNADGEYWGVEVEWINKNRYCWEIRDIGNFVGFSLVRENPVKPPDWAIRQGDVFFVSLKDNIPVDIDIETVYQEYTTTNTLPEMLEHCIFSAPIKEVKQKGNEYLLIFDSENGVEISHRNHQTVKFNSNHILAWGVGGKVHYEPPYPSSKD